MSGGSAMQNDFNQNPYKDDSQDPITDANEAMPEENTESQQDSFYQSRQEENSDYLKNDFFESGQEIPRWTPYGEEPVRNQMPRRPQRQKRRWIIPLVIVLVIMLAAISVGVIFGARRLSAYVSNASTNVADTRTITEQSAAENTATVQTADNGSRSSASGSGYVVTDVTSIVEDVFPSVVSITSRSLVESGGYGSYWNFFFGGRYGSGSGGESKEVESGIGSGTIISQNESELLILTSYHVVEGSSSLYVTFVDGTSVDGSIKSQSDEKDIAIVAVPLADIPAETKDQIKIATLSTGETKVGEGAIVIGNALGYGMSVTSGIISATDRQIQVDGKVLNVMQTDAAINGGNSGGCVLNKYGEIIGISEAKIVTSNVEGMCYAIPIASNLDLIKSLLNTGGEISNLPGEETASGQGAYLGIRGRDIDNDLANRYGMPKGIYIASTVEGSGAQAAGLQEGDIIVGMDNVSFSTMDELQEQLSRHNPGDTVSVVIMREIDGSYKQMKVDVVLSEAFS